RSTGTPPTGGPVTSPPDSATVVASPAPSLTVVKSAAPLDQDAFVVGEVITYSFVVTNTGNVTLTNVGVNEISFSGTGPAPVPVCPPGALAPEAQRTCTATYTVTQADVDAGSITNAAVGTADPPTGPPVVSPASDAIVPATAAPAL